MNLARLLPCESTLVSPQEVDEWEIKREDVELLDKALGEGAFGAVYKGVLQPKVMEKLSRRKKAHERDRRFSMKCVVAVKMLKGMYLIWTPMGDKEVSLLYSEVSLFQRLKYMQEWYLG